MANVNWMIDHGTFIRNNPESTIPLNVRIGDDA